MSVLFGFVISSPKLDEVPRKRRRINTETDNPTSPTPGPSNSVRQVVSNMLRTQVANDIQTPPPNVSTSSLSSTGHSIQILLHNGFPTPILPLPYKPRKTPSSNHHEISQTLSVRDFILMNQLPLINQCNLYAHHKQRQHSISGQHKQTQNRNNQK